MANRERFNRFLLYFLVVFGVAADQATKYAVFAWLANVPGNHYVLFRTTPEADDPVEGFALVAQYQHSDDAEHRVLTDSNGKPIPHVNHGALFGFLRDHKTPANLLFATISIVAATGFLIWGSKSSTARDRWMCVCLGLIVAGTLGNLYDRLVFNGVRDFLHWDYFYNWPVFNVADCCLVTGATLLLLQAMFTNPTAKDSTEPKDDAPKLTMPRTGNDVLVGAVNSAQS
jgi:signal peptidase II